MMEERRSEYDASLLLTRAALVFVGFLVLFVCLIIGIQVTRAGEANTESWAALMSIIGWATAQAQVLYSNRFGSTLSATKKDAAIQTLAQAAPLQTALAVAASRNEPVPAVPLAAAVQTVAPESVIPTAPSPQEKP